MEQKKSHGGARVGAGRKSKDGRKTVADVMCAVDQETLNLLYEFGAQYGFGYALRELAHAYMAMRDSADENASYVTARGHRKPTITPPAGGHVSDNTAAGAGERKAVKRVENPRKRYEHRGAYLERTGGGAAPKMPVRKIVSEYRDGVRLSMHTHMRLQEQADREFEEAMVVYHEACGM